MNNRFIATELNIPPIMLTQKCARPHGSLLTWTIRQILIHEYNHLNPNHREFLCDFLCDLVYGSKGYAEGKTDAFMKEQLLFPNDHLQRLAMIHSKNNPFGIKV